MRTKILTLRFSSTLGSFDDSALQAFARDKEILAFREHFSCVNEVPHMACVLTWQDPVVSEPDLAATRELDGQRESDDTSRATRGRTAHNRPDPAVGLDEAGRALFNTLRQWRLEKSRHEGVPPLPVKPGTFEPVEFYKASKLQVDEAPPPPALGSPPPWHGLPPELEVDRERGLRRLAARTYNTKCTTCSWGCKMAVEMILDQGNPDRRRTRAETFRYGPKSCALYRPGPERVAPGRKGMSWSEADWVDEDATAHCGPDE